MNEFILYLLKSTICLSSLYLVFRSLMRKESFFALNRMLLLAIVLFSLTAPMVPIPQIIRSATPIQMLPAFTGTQNLLQELPQTGINDIVEITTQPAAVKQPAVFPVRQLIQYGYLIGLLVTLLILIRGIVFIFLLFHKSRMIRMENFRLLIVDTEIPAFSFGRNVVISGQDYDDHSLVILAHEQAHIRLNHFFDLLLLEAVKIIHWFNPVVYLLIRDMKEIHEFQADQSTLTKGFDATQYQLLIIQKGVGSQWFALANSFNYCQIKKRITMMNKQKTNKAWSWKVATFLPLLALLLMAFGRKAENVPLNQSISLKEVSTYMTDSLKQWSEADFSKPDQLLKEFPHKTILGVDIQINSKSQIRAMHENSSLKELADYVRIFKDYDFSTEKTKRGFRKIVINGQERMGPIYILMIIKDIDTLPAEYQKMLNVIGNTILEIREKYAKEIFNTPYSKLTSAQRDEIIKLVPNETVFAKTPVLASEVQ